MWVIPRKAARSDGLGKNKVEAGICLERRCGRGGGVGSKAKGAGSGHIASALIRAALFKRASRRRRRAGEIRRLAERAPVHPGAATSRIRCTIDARNVEIKLVDQRVGRRRLN